MIPDFIYNELKNAGDILNKSLLKELETSGQKLSFCNRVIWLNAMDMRDKSEKYYFSLIRIVVYGKKVASNTISHYPSTKKEFVFRARLWADNDMMSYIN